MGDSVRRDRGELVAEILALLDKMERATRADVCQLLGVAEDVCGAMMSRLNFNGPRTGKRIYIVDWRWDFPGERNYPRAVYARCITGTERDKPKPATPNFVDKAGRAAELKRNAAAKRKREADAKRAKRDAKRKVERDHAKKKAMSSVFNWATSLRPVRKTANKVAATSHGQRFTKKD